MGICVQEYQPTKPRREKYPPSEFCILSQLTQSVIVLVGVPMSGSSELIFIEPGAKWCVFITTTSARTFCKTSVHSWRMFTFQQDNELLLIERAAQWSICFNILHFHPTVVMVTQQSRR